MVKTGKAVIFFLFFVANPYEYLGAEYQDDAGAFFGPGRRYELLEMHKDRPIAKNLDRVYDDMMTFGEQKGLKDDVRLLGIEFG